MMSRNGVVSHKVAQALVLVVGYTRGLIVEKRGHKSPKIEVRLPSDYLK
jgi:hypothetical protein